MGPSENERPREIKSYLHFFRPIFNFNKKERFSKLLKTNQKGDVHGNEDFNKCGIIECPKSDEHE